MAKNSIHSTTQQFLDIYDVTNNVIIMKDGSTAVVLTVDALNFGLLAEEEQDGIIYAYASLLNSLTYPIQILIKSQTKDVTNYLQLLQDQIEETTSKLKKSQISEYKNFVAELIQERNVLDKKFYVVIPSTALEMGIVTPQSVIPGVKTTSVDSFERSYILEKARNNLEPKRDHLISQFNRIGLYARQLDTQEIIQLFYTSYNPEAVEGQNLTDSRNYTTPLVKARVQGNFMTDSTNPNQPAQTPQAPTVPQPVQQTPPQAQPISPVPEPSTPTAPMADIPISNEKTPSPAPSTTQPTSAQSTSTPVEPANSQPPTPAQPATTTSVQSPTKPTPTPEEVVAASTETQTETPASGQTAVSSTPTPPTVEDAQSAINSTIQELGTHSEAPLSQPGSAQTPAATGTPSVPPTQPTSAESTSTPVEPANSQPPTPAQPAATNTDAMPQLPEI